MPLSHRDYTVACICPIGMEVAPIKAILDQRHPSLLAERGQNSYTLGEITGCNIVIAVLPEIGTNSVATVATQLLNDFPSIRFGLLVEIGGGIPDQDNASDIRLGDVMVSKPTNTFGGVVLRLCSPSSRCKRMSTTVSRYLVPARLLRRGARQQSPDRPYLPARQYNPFSI